MKEKKLIIEIMQSLGFTVEYDQWDDKHKQWIRFRHENDSEQLQDFAMIWYKKSTMRANLQKAAGILMSIAKYLKIQEINSYL